MMIPRFAPTPHVRSIVHGDRTVLLDLRRERYYSLDEVGTRVWMLLSEGEGADVPSIVARLGEEFDASTEQLTTDVHALLRHLRDELKVINQLEPRKIEHAPSWFACVATLTMVTIALRVVGLQRSLRLAERLARRVPMVTEPSPEFITDLVRKIDTAAAFFPGRALCLEQSLALYVCLRRVGVPAHLRIGAQPYPFAAHAWVEYRGEPVGTSSDHIGKFVPFERLVEVI